MSATRVREDMQQVDEDSDIVHLTCCRDDGPPMFALCGWLCTEHAPDTDPSPECVVCCDIADGFPADVCVHGGRCE